MSKRTVEIMEQCSPIFAMLQDERRQEIMRLLFDNDELSVTELTHRLELSRPAVSHHLKLLLEAKLVAVRPEGKERYYRMALQNALTLLKQLTASIDEDMKSKTK